MRRRPAPALPAHPLGDDRRPIKVTHHCLHCFSVRRQDVANLVDWLADKFGLRLDHVRGDWFTLGRADSCEDLVSYDLETGLILAYGRCDAALRELAVATSPAARLAAGD